PRATVRSSKRYRPHAAIRAVSRDAEFAARLDGAVLTTDPVMPGGNATMTNESPANQARLYDEGFRRAAWRLIPFLVFLFVLAWIDRVNVGFAKLSMLSDLGFSETVYGLGAGIFFIGYFLCEVPSNLLLEKIGAKKT